MIYVFLSDCNVLIDHISKDYEFNNSKDRIMQRMLRDKIQDNIIHINRRRLNSYEYLQNRVTKYLDSTDEDGYIVLTIDQTLNSTLLESLDNISKDLGVEMSLFHSFTSILNFQLNDLAEITMESITQIDKEDYKGFAELSKGMTKLEDVIKLYLDLDIEQSKKEIQNFLNVSWNKCSYDIANDKMYVSTQDFRLPDKLSDIIKTFKLADSVQSDSKLHFDIANEKECKRLQMYKENLKGLQPYE